MSKRPGGLTALAVLNFVFGGLGAIGYLLSLAALGAVDAISDAAVQEGVAEAGVSTGGFYLWFLIGLVGVALMITAGVGYLGQKKFLGRTLGNAYAAVAILATVIGLTAASQSFGVLTLVGLVYPVLTLILLNTTFKDDFVN